MFKEIDMKILLWSLFSAVLSSLLVVPAYAQWDPNRPIRIVVPYPPGGASDVAARSISDRVGKKLGQPVIVENRAGAGGIIGTDLVFRAEPDGYTLLLGASDAITIAPHLQPELTKYKPEEFVAIAPVNQVATVLVTRSGLGVKNVSELIALARTSKLSYSSWGNGSLGHVSGEAFRSVAKIDLLNVPYQGAAPAAQAVLGGEVDLMFMPGPLWITFRERVVSLGATSAEPFQNVPTLTEQGFPVVVAVWQGILAPPGTPRPAVERLHKVFAEVMAEPETQERFRTMGSIPLHATQAEFAKMIREEVQTWGKRLAEYDIKPIK
jgi:tripartite-type tricarboxylate transporter receptor subunit TctC